MSTVIKVESISKQYRLGDVGTGSLAHDLNRSWHKIRGKEDPYLKIGEANDRTVKGSSDYVWALKDINFEVQQGEVIGIIGRNGAGKSTLLKILSRTTMPTTGNIKIKGRIASLLEVGTGFHPELSGRDNIFLNGAILGMTKREIKSKFDEIVDFAGVERYIDTPVKRYSSGMYVRLAFGVAAHLEPEILIVDEVLAVGDIEFQKKALGKMKDVSTNDGRTVLFVSHNLSAIENLCNRCIVMGNGKLSFEGNVQDSLERYHKEIVRKSNLKLAERKDRVGNGKLLVTDILFSNKELQEISNIKSGQDFNIELTIKNNTFPNELNDVVASIAIMDQREQVVFFVRSNFTAENLKFVNAQSKIVCSISEINLAASTYSITVFLGYQETETYDLVTNAAELVIDGGDFFGTGSIGLPSFSKLLNKANWAVS